MQSILKSIISRKFVQLWLVLTGLLVSTDILAATVNIATAPLVSATTSQVLPNLLYILDNSGSMASDYMPDYVNDSNKCKSTNTAGDFSASCGFGDPPYNSSAFNSIYYNPTIRYSPAVNALGTEQKTMDRAGTAGWTIVPVDFYRVYDTSDQSLVPVAGDASQGYADKVWCNTNAATLADLTNPLVCKKNGPQYIYPNNTGVTASSFNRPYTLNGYPYYYTVSPGEYCSDAKLTTCVTSTVTTGAFTFPATLRWCNSSARTNCQAKYLNSAGYTFAKWTGINNGSSATGSIKINTDTTGCGTAGLPSCAAPSAMNISDITVDGTRIVATPVPSNLNITDTTNSTQRNTLAANIASAINAFVPSSGEDFTASSSGDLVTITRVNVGPVALPFMGTIDVTADSVTRPSTTGTVAVGSVTFTRARSSTTMNNMKVGTTVIMSATVTTTTSGTDNLPDMATKVKNAINAHLPASGYTASCTGGAICTGATVNITATTAGSAKNGTISSSLGSGSVGGGNLRYNVSNVSGGADSTSAKTYTIPNLITQFTGGTSSVNSFNRVDIEPGTLSYPKATTRTDCGGSTCTYDEEMTNFANWFSYYHTRMLMMKTSTSRAFRAIDTRYRVGFITINDTSYYLPIDQFGGTQKANWYAKLFSAFGNSSTPLRTALSTAGRIFAGKKPIGTSDPMQYSCQQNFALLTTDGYWNGGGGLQINGSTSIGNLDGTGTGLPQYEGATASTDTLADAAKYYYDTDLRDSSLGNCQGALGASTNVCPNNVFVSPTDNNVKQHMTTFTLGLGVDGELTYTSDYQNATSGDYFDIKQGTKDWPVPAADTQRAVDDLWHAAVNGQGTYFSAKDPNQLNKSLNEALQSIGASVGAGAAAATSTLNPVAGDNSAYVASYSTVKWTGNLESRDVNIITGAVSRDAAWCVESINVAGSCSAPGSEVTEDVGGATVTYCVTPSSTTPAACPAGAILSGTDCKVEIASSCLGAMTDNVGPALSNRRILIKDGATNNLVNFTYANLSAAQKPYFETTWLSTNLSQWATLSTAQQTAVGGANIVNFLRGETGFEDKPSNAPPTFGKTTDDRLFRKREATLGDALESTPIFVGASKLNYTDLNYGPETLSGTHKNITAGRAGTVYIGTNDGMMHAFNSSNGEERWAYIPSMVITNLYKLADKNYATLHTNYVNGDAIVSDICDANCSTASAHWKTILVGGLNGGGSGYYALDVTDPSTPTLLWEFTSANDDDLGVSFGNPIITKKADGTWVVLVTSGYNNTTGTNPGKGFLYVLNANTGVKIDKYATGVGNATTPSGFAKVSAFVNDPDRNNTALYVYGGDLLGNLWRFNINLAQSATNPFKVAVLKDNQTPTPQPQPITVAPELSGIGNKQLIFVGTGKYLEVADLTDTQRQTLYAITDDASATATLDNPRSSPTMVSQTLVNAGATRTISSPQTVNLPTDRGWYIDLPDSGERQNIPAQLVFGTLLVPTIVPSNTVCSPGGYGWLNFVDFKTGLPVAGSIVGSKENAPIVGVNVLYVGGVPKVSLVTSDDPTPHFPAVQPSFKSNASGFANRRVIWRELTE
jgi:type IV pilus assembly protein PilY1